MRRLVQSSLIASAFVLLGGPASAQMTMPKGAGQQPAAQTRAMMSECSAMMQEVMADPVVRKRMMAIMQKHMQQHAGHGTMMMTPGMPSANTMQGGDGSSGSSSHEAHHTPVPAATPISPSSPTAAPSP